MREWGQPMEGLGKLPLQRLRSTNWKMGWAWKIDRPTSQHPGWLARLSLPWEDWLTVGDAGIYSLISWWAISFVVFSYHPLASTPP